MSFTIDHALPKYRATSFKKDTGKCLKELFSFVHNILHKIVMSASCSDTRNRKST